MTGSAVCVKDQWLLPAERSGECVVGLDPRGFDLVNWNIFKGRREGWQADFSAFGWKPDLYVLQEAYLTHDLRKFLAQEGLKWNLAPGFEYKGIETGVLTAARVAPSDYCLLRTREPLLRISKSTLITRYPFAGVGEMLLVANIHAINFTPASGHFRQYWRRIENALAIYDGPLILAGDFNTWSAGRVSVVRQAAKRLKLQAVKFDLRKQTKIFGHIVDHVYYRGLILVESDGLEVTTSDHNPLLVRFRLPDSAPQAPR